MKTRTDSTPEENADSPATGADALLPIVSTLATPAVAAGAIRALKFLAGAIRRHPAQTALSAVGLVLVARKVLRDRRNEERLLLR